MKTTRRLSPDDLNGIARSAVNSLYGAKAPAHLTDDDRDEWQAEANRLFIIACDSLTGVTDAETAYNRTKAAVLNEMAP